MPTGAITQYIDVAQLVLYAFWVFFFGLIFYLHRENKREGYPLDSESAGRVIVQGFPAIPKPKTYLLRSGRVVLTPDPARDDRREIAARSFAGHFGSPIVPTGNPMLDGVGPGSYAMRPDTVDLTAHDQPRIVPMRIAGAGVEPKDVDPRGLPVVGCDGKVGGTVKDLWIDRAEIAFRYLEIDVAGAPGARTVLVPMNFARVKARHVQVDAITGAQFAAVPTTKSTEQITMFEEERVMGYYGGGTLYATAARSEPLL